MESLRPSSASEAISDTSGTLDSALRVGGLVPDPYCCPFLLIGNPGVSYPGAVTLLTSADMVLGALISLKLIVLMLLRACATTGLVLIRLVLTG